MHPPRASHDPKMIGLWKVGRTLGKGFSGHVRIARHSKTGQYAAIKIIPKGSLGSRVSLNRLADEVEHTVLAVEREIVVMKLVDHPNIMKLYDVWETSSSLYLILEYVQGGELFEYLCSEGRRPNDEALNYFQQIICAVDYCHRFNIAHRDLKLENILIDQNFNIKVADFGMATWQDSAEGKLLRTSCGSPHYAAPEIISGNPYQGANADIWSCGIILYALLAAKLPFDDDDCPTLLRKITVGKFNMPKDIDPQAQDLISRMLTTDVTKRIAMQEIMRHPFFLSQPLKNPNAMPSDLNIDTIARPIGSLSAIDPDIFANLRTLWHGMQDSELVASLMSPDRNWQKGIYYLLSNYRKRHLGIQKEEETIQAQLERKRSKQLQRWRPSDLYLPPRAGPPTPRRARDHNRESVYSTMSFVHVHKPVDSSPVISLEVPSPMEMTVASTPDIRIEEMDLSVVSVPELEDERVQLFFQQVANHLNVLQARTASNGTPRLGSLAPSSPDEPPVLRLPDDALAPLSSKIGGRTTNLSDLSPFSEAPLDQSSTRPLSVRRKSRLPRPVTPRTNNKENAVHITESDLIHRRSPLLQHTFEIMDNNKPIPKASPVLRQPSKLKKKRISLKPPISPIFSEAGSSFSNPSSSSSGGPPRRTWLDNVFKFKTATYFLLSRYDVHTTRSECRKLLIEMDMLVSLEESEKLGVLKCRSQDVKDANNMILGLKAIKFRVEMQWPSPELCHEGFLVSLVLIQEKGSLDAFKSIYQQLASTWSLGQPNKPPSILSATPSSTNAVGGY